MYPLSVEENTTDKNLTINNSTFVNLFLTSVPVGICAFIGIGTGLKVGKWVLKRFLKKKNQDKKDEDHFSPGEFLQHIPSFLGG